MKIIHTSDWHLGHELYQFDRTEEHTAFLTQLAEIVAKEQPDVLVVSGDIYHNATPSNTVMRLFTDRLEAICRACPTMQTVITAGNHDSSSRLEVSRTLWEHLGVHVIGRVEKKDNAVDLDRHIIPVYSREKQKTGYVLALPHIFQQSFPALVEGTPREERPRQFFQALADRMAAVNTEGLPVVMMAHLAIQDCDMTGHDTLRGGMEFLPITDLKVDYDYLALGHIHCPQMIGKHPARYCGSPIPVSFDENYPHSVTVVELGVHGDQPKLRTVDISNPWPLKTFPAEAVPFEEALKQLSAFPDGEKAYLRLHVQLEDVPPHNAIERACKAVEGKQCRFCCFKWEQKAVEQTSEVPAFVDVDQMKAQSPVEIASAYYRNKYGNPLSEDLTDMLEQVVQMVGQKEK